MSYNFYRISIEQEIVNNGPIIHIGAATIGLKLKQLYGAIIIKGLDLKYTNKRSKEYTDYFHYMDFYVSNDDKNELNYSLKTNKKLDIIISLDQKWHLETVDVNINLLDGSALSITTQFNYKNKNIIFDDNYSFANREGFYRDEYTTYYEIEDDTNCKENSENINNEGHKNNPRMVT